MTESLEGTFEPGTVFQDRYEILSVLGRGGFGEVYRSKQLSTGQDVAIKVIRSAFGTISESDPRSARFVREMRLCAQLHHPNIVRLLDSGQTPDGQLFTVFALVPGMDLRNVLKSEGKLNPTEAVRLMGQVLDALSAAHNQGVVHRDLKPANIMVTTTGARRNATVLDFGIGAFVKQELADQELQKITGTGQMLGTPAYSPPEQLMGVQPTTRSDLYSWGLVFLEALTGKPAYTGNTLPQIVFQQIDPKPVPIPANIVEHPLGRLIRKVLNKDVAKRDVTADSALLELESIDVSFLNQDRQHVVLQSDSSDISRTAATLDERSFSPVPKRPSEMPYRLESSQGTVEGERRQLTAMGCSLSVIGPEDEDVDLELYEETLAWLQAACEEVARRFDGYVANLVSDRALIYFGYPIAHEDDARRAARAARSLVQSVRERVGDKGSLTPEIRIGLHTGMVISRSSVDPSKIGTLDVVGPTTNVATQLSAAAEPNGILVSKTTGEILKETFVLGEFESQRVRGRAHPVEVAPLESERSEPRTVTGLFPLDAPPMVGRDRELSLLEGQWRGSRDGAGSAVLISGEAGIGKSRLAAELIRNVVGTSGTVLEGHCAAESQASPLEPFIELITKTIGLDHTDDDDEKIQRIDDYLRERGFDPCDATPILGMLLSLPVDLTGCPSLAEDLSPQKRKEMTFDAIISLLFTLSEEQPLMLLIEDLHWADPTTLELLGQMLDEVDEAALCLVFTARPEFHHTWPATKLTQIPLGRLGPDQISEMVEGLTSNKPIPRELLDEIVKKTDGVSLFVEELVEMLLRQGMLYEENGRYLSKGGISDLSIPASLRDLLTSKLDRLGSAKGTAQLAATLGREFTFELLEAVSARKDEALEADVKALIEADLIRRQRRMRQKRLIFKHALIRDTAYESLLSSTRRKYHGQIASTLEERFPDQVTKRPDLMAYHHAQAEQYTSALGYAQKAGMGALSRSANQEALQQAKTALKWLDGIDDPSQRSTFELSLNGVISPALMGISGFASPDLAEVSARSIELLDHVGDSPLTFPTLFGVTTYYHIHNDRKQARELAEKLLEVAKESGDKGQICAATCQLAHCSWIESDFDGSRKLFEEALGLYELDEHRHLAPMFGYDMFCWAKMTVAMVYWSQGEPERALESVLAARQHAIDIKHANSLGLSLLYVSMIHHYNDDHDSCRASTDELDEACKKHGLFYNMSYGGMLSCWAHHDVDTAKMIVAGVEASGALLAMSYYPATLAQTLFDKGEHKEAIETLEECLNHANGTGETYYLPVLYRLKGEWLLEMGKVEAGIANIDKALELSKSQGLRMHALQAAVVLFRHHRGSDREAAARDALSSVCSSFDVEPQPALLTEAKALLG